jgi:glycyl-tRNA synthetase
MDSKKPSMEEIVSLAKRRGFVFQASEIYGGIAGFYDWGPYGVELTRNIKDAWWKAFVYGHRNVVGLDSAIIQNPKLWQASGHVDTFVDPMVDCKNCKHRFRADHLSGIETKDLKKYDTALADVACPNCGKKHTFTPARTFNMMFKTYVGPTGDEDSIAYLRPETAGGIFAQFENVRDTSRQKLPFGIAQIGKAFRNEITPSDFVFRLRELEQMELECFINPKDQDKEYKYWRQFAMDFLLGLGLDKAKLKFRDHADDERAHYAAASVDIEYAYPFGSKELYGIANRTDYDLKAHAKMTGKDITIQDGDETITPYVIEPSVGVERLALALIHSAYTEEEVKGEKRVVLKFHPEIAPVKVAILPHHWLEKSGNP